MLFQGHVKIAIVCKSFHTLRLEKSESNKKQMHCYKTIVFFISITDGQKTTNSFLNKYLSDIQCRKSGKKYSIWLKFHTAILPKKL